MNIRIYIKMIIALGLGLLPVCLFIIFPVFAHADTDISPSTIGSDLTWTPDQNPIVLSGLVTVSQGMTLTIAPGTVVQFSGGSDLFIKGGLIKAEGTSQAPITFSSASSTQSKDWDINVTGTLPTNMINAIATSTTASHLVENSPASSIFSFVTISGAAAGLDLQNAQAYLGHVTIKDSGEGIVASNSVVELDQSTVSSIDNDGFSMTIDSLADVSSTAFSDIAGTIMLVSRSSRAELFDDTFDTSGGDPDRDGSALLVTRGTVFVRRDKFIGGGSDDGIELSGGSSLDMQHSSLSGFEGDALILNDPSSADIERNDFSNNALAVEDDERTSPLVLVHNTFSNNRASILDDVYQIAGNLSADDNWWGSTSLPPHQDYDSSDVIEPGSPQNGISNGVTVDSVLQRDDTADGHSSVAFFPGVEGSRLYEPDTSDSGEDQLWEPNFLSDIHKLFLDGNGKSLDPSIYTRDIINKVSVAGIGPSVYQDFTLMMNGLVSDGTIHAWEPLPYDWRLSLSDILNDGQAIATTANGENVSYTNPLGTDANDISYVRQQIRDLARYSDTGKVTVIAHSLGGLVAKGFIDQLSREKASGDDDLADKIDTFVPVAVPEIGTPQAVASLFHGDDLELLHGLLLSQDTARQFAYDMPSAYELLPDPSYFSASTDPVITFDGSLQSIAGYDPLSSINSFSSFSNFIRSGFTHQEVSASTSSIANLTLFNDLSSSESGDQSSPLVAAMRTIQVAGIGLSTLSSIQYSATPTCTGAFLQKTDLCTPGFSLDHSPTFVDSGDGTVLARSAAFLDADTYFLNLHDYNQSMAVSSNDADVLGSGLFVSNRSHADIFEVEPLRDLLKEIIETDPGSQGPLPLPQFMTYLPLSSTPVPFDSATIPSEDKITVDVDDTASLDAYDVDGDHTGMVKNTDGGDLDYLEENIPNSSYEKIGDATYVTVDLPKTTGVASPQIVADLVTNAAPDPDPDGFDFHIAGDSLGVANIEVKTVENGATKAEHFEDVPVTPLLQAHLDISDALTTTLTLDVNGDGIPDLVVSPDDSNQTDSFDPLLYLETLKRTIESLAPYCVTQDSMSSLTAEIDEKTALIEQGQIPTAAATIEDDMPQAASGPMTASEAALIVSQTQVLLDDLK